MNKQTVPAQNSFTKDFHIFITNIYFVWPIILIAWVLFFLQPQNIYSQYAVDVHIPILEKLTLPTPRPLAENITGRSIPNLTAQGVIIRDLTTNMSLYEKNIDEKLYPASTTKIMTALVALKDYKLDDIVTVAKIIPEPAKMNLFKGEQISVENLLYAILIQSANDGAYALAEHHEGGVEKFVERMNEEAQALNLKNTHFTNPIGFDDPNHYSTVADLALLTQEARKNPLITKIVSIPQMTVTDVSNKYTHPLKNVNELLGKVLGVTGFKTGYTEIAGQALITTVNRDGHDLLFIVLKSADRFGETEKLINWVFANFEWKAY